MFCIEACNLWNWDSVGKPTESYFIWLTDTNNADKAIEEEWQAYCEEELAKNSEEAEGQPPEAWKGLWNRAPMFSCLMSREKCLYFVFP